MVPSWNGAKDPAGPYDGRCGAERNFGGQAKLAWITDGLSRTTVALEIAYRPNLYNREGLEGRSDDGQKITKKIWNVSKGPGWAQTNFYGLSPFAETPINKSNHQSGRFSFHPGGVNNAFLDGSVRFLDESTDVAVLRDLTSRAGVERIGWSRP